jgi:hypothetical protein
MTTGPTDHLNLDAIVAFADGEMPMVAYQRAAAHVARCPQFGSRLMYLDKGKFVRGISCQIPLSGFISRYSKYRHPIYRQFCDKARSSTS